MRGRESPRRGIQPADGWAKVEGPGSRSSSWCMGRKPCADSKGRNPLGRGARGRRLLPGGGCNGRSGAAPPCQAGWRRAKRGKTTHRLSSQPIHIFGLCRQARVASTVFLTASPNGTAGTLVRYARAANIPVALRAGTTFGKHWALREIGIVLTVRTVGLAGCGTSRRAADVMLVGVGADQVVRDGAPQRRRSPVLPGRHPE